MNDPRTKVDDALGAAHSYLHAIKRLAEKALDGGGDDYCAIDLMVRDAIREISVAQDVFDEMEAA